MTIGNIYSQNNVDFIETRNNLNSKLNVIGNVVCSKNVFLTSKPANIKNIHINQIANPIVNPTYVNSQTISIDYTNKYKYYTIDIASSPINQNFTCFLENISPDFTQKNKIYHFQFHINYENIVPSPTYNLFYCNLLNIQGSQYNILFTGGNPTIPSYTKNIIQNVEIIISQNSIWKIVSTVTKYKI